MPCTSQPNLTPTQKQLMDQAIARLNAALGNGQASVVVGASGSIAFKGWNEREAVTDLCAYRALASRNSPELRKAIMRAEAMAGRKVDARAVAAGVHSHDGGHSWGQP